jgi:transposase
MKIQLSKPAQKRERYTDQYKREALELWRNSGRSAAEVATKLGIRPPLLYRWARLHRITTTKSASSGEESKERVERLERENRQLRQENAKLLEQREVLKKSLGILSEVPHRGMPESKR